MSIPCVVNTKIAMHLLKDGDRVRMDGSGGRIEIIALEATTQLRSKGRSCKSARPASGSDRACSFGQLIERRDHGNSNHSVAQ
jgi:phosphoenolpyruvate-protein kinase (PTS system EI component)